MIVFGMLLAPAVFGGNSPLEQQASATAGGGIEFSLPYGYLDFLPGVTVRASLPLELHPWKEPALDEVAVAGRLHWGNRLMVYGGQLSFGGPTSLFTTAAPTMTLNPLAGFAFPATTVSVGMPGFSGSSAPYGGAVVASLGTGFAKDRVRLWATGSQRKRFFAGATLPFQVAAVELSLSTTAGVWFLEENLPSLEDSWFASTPVYHEVWLKGLALEGRLTWSGLRLYGSGVVVEQPWGGFGFWGRLRGSVEVTAGKVPLRLLAGIYGGRPESITADGSVLRETLQVYVNPQVTVELGELAAVLEEGRLQLGVAFGASFKNTNQLQPESFADGKLRGGVAAIFPQWQLQLVGEWTGIRLGNLELKESLRSQEKYGGELSLTLHQLIPRSRIRLSGSGHYENRGGPEKDRIVVAGDVSLYHGGGSNRWFSLIPDLDASTQVVFRRMDGFYSAATEAKASWKVPLPFVTVGAWVAVHLKHTTR